MLKLHKNIRFSFLFIVLVGALLVFNSCSDRNQAQESSSISQVRTFVLARDFAPGQLEAHYNKHKYEFGDISQEEYLNNARLLLNSAPSGDILEKRRSNGDVLHYRVSNSEFAVMARDGRIRTYFKADYKYWLKQ